MSEQMEYLGQLSLEGHLAREARIDALVKALEAIANHPENKQATRTDESSYGVGWAFYNIQNIARKALKPYPVGTSGQ